MTKILAFQPGSQGEPVQPQTPLNQNRNAGPGGSREIKKNPPLSVADLWSRFQAWVREQSGNPREPSPEIRNHSAKERALPFQGIPQSPSSKYEGLIREIKNAAKAQLRESQEGKVIHQQDSAENSGEEKPSVEELEQGIIIYLFDGDRELFPPLD